MSIDPTSVDHMAKLIQGLKAEYRTSVGVSTDAWSWAITTRTYNWLRYIDHIRRTCPLPARKLRKCQMRAYHRYCKRERRRFGL